MNLFSVEGREERQYSKGKWVELKAHPGRVYRIEEYDSSMIPPIWLENNPMPHYAHELNLLSHPDAEISLQLSQAA